MNEAETHAEPIASYWSPPLADHHQPNRTI